MRRAGRSMVARWAVLACAIGATALGPHHACAQTPPPATTGTAPSDPKEAARAFGKEGVALYDAGKYVEAIERFKKAQSVYSLPQNLAYLARCHGKLGHLLLARDAYTEAVSIKLAAGSEQKTRDAQAIAKEELDALKKRIPKLEITVTGAAADTTTVKIDGALLTPAELSAAELIGREVDPGKHVVIASATGFPAVERTVEVPESSVTPLTLELRPAPPAAAPAPAAPLPSIAPSIAPSTAPPGGDAGKTQGSLAPAIAAFGFGVAGIGVGAVTGVMALGKAGELKSKCPQVKGCPPEYQAIANDAHTLALVSTIGFVAGAAGLVAGGVLIIVRRSSGKPSAGVHDVRAVVGVGSIGMEGSF